jgi:hypothetical protein
MSRHGLGLLRRNAVVDRQVGAEESQDASIARCALSQLTTTKRSGRSNSLTQRLALLNASESITRYSKELIN